MRHAAVIRTSSVSGVAQIGWIVEESSRRTMSNNTVASATCASARFGGGGITCCMQVSCQLLPSPLQALHDSLLFSFSLHCFILFFVVSSFYSFLFTFFKSTRQDTRGLFRLNCDDIVLLAVVFCLSLFQFVISQYVQALLCLI